MNREELLAVLEFVSSREHHFHLRHSKGEEVQLVEAQGRIGFLIKENAKLGELCESLRSAEIGLSEKKIEECVKKAIIALVEESHVINKQSVQEMADALNAKERKS